MADKTKGNAVDNGNAIKRSASSPSHRCGLPVLALQVPREGYQIALYFNGDGEFISRVNGVETRLHPWVGIQLEAFGASRDWKRKDVEKYEPIDVMKWLKAQEDKG